MDVSQPNLKTIRFEGEMLPLWAQTLDVAAMLAATPLETRQWFSRFTRSSGTDDASTVAFQCRTLQAALQTYRQTVLEALAHPPGKRPTLKVMDAWMYSLDTMILQSSTTKTCSWFLDSPEDEKDNPGGGDITLRRI